MSDPQQRHGLQPSSLLHPWDFPGKSTGVGCHCLLHPSWTAAAAAAKSLQSCPTLCDPMTVAHQAPCPWDSPGKNTGVGCHFLQCMKVKSESEVAQCCPTLSDPMDCSLPSSSHGIAQPSDPLNSWNFTCGLPYQNTERRWLSINQKAGSYQHQIF